MTKARSFGLPQFLRRWFEDLFVDLTLLGLLVQITSSDPAGNMIQKFFSRHQQFDDYITYMLTYSKSNSVHLDLFLITGFGMPLGLWNPSRLAPGYGGIDPTSVVSCLR